MRTHTENISLELKNRWMFDNKCCWTIGTEIKKTSLLSFKTSTVHFFLKITSMHASMTSSSLKLCPFLTLLRINVPSQDFPLPVYPCLHVHEYDPGIFVQFASS